MPTQRRYPVHTASLKQRLFDLTDIAVDLFDANLWERHTDAKAELDEMRLKAARSTNEKLVLRWKQLAQGFNDHLRRDAGATVFLHGTMGQGSGADYFD